MSLLGIIARTVLASTAALGPARGPTAAPAPQAFAPTAAPVAVTPAAAAAAPASAADVVDRVQQFYAGIKQVTASFRQAVTNDTFGSTKTSDGTVWIAKPGKMRWDYLEKKDIDTEVDGKPAKKTEVKVKKSFISNGKSLYVVEHDNKQVVKKSLQQDLMPVAVSFLYGKGNLKAEFNPELDTTGKYGAQGDLVLKLAPKLPSAQYKNLYLVVSRADFHVSQSIIVDSSNNVNHFRFYRPDFQSPVKDAYFEFDERSVKNYRVIDADASKDGLANGAIAQPAPKATAPLAKP